MPGPTLPVWRPLPVRLDPAAGATPRSLAGQLLLTLALAVVGLGLTFLLRWLNGWGLSIEIPGIALGWSIYPPLPIAVLTLLWVGFWPAFGAITLTNLYYGGAVLDLTGPWLAAYTLVDTLALVIVAMSFATTGARIDLRSRAAKVTFAFAALLAAVSLAPGALSGGGETQSWAGSLSAIEHWISGALLTFFLLVAPALYFLTAPVLRLRERLFPADRAGGPVRPRAAAWCVAFVVATSAFIVGTHVLVSIRVSDALAQGAAQSAVELVTSTGRLFGLVGYTLVIPIAALIAGLLYLGSRMTEDLQRRVEQQTHRLRQTVGQLEHAQRLTRTGAWRLDLLTDELHWSAGVYPMFGLARSEFGASYEDFISCVHPDDRETLEALQARALAGVEELDFEHRIVLPDGEVRWVHERAGLQTDEGDGKTYLVGTVIDTTEWRRRAEEREEAQTRRVLLENAIDQAEEGVAVTDARGRVEYASTPIENFFGHSASELEGQPLPVLFSGSVRRREVWDQLELGQSWSETVRLRNDEVAASVNVTPVLDANGSPIHLVAIFHDVTERDELEAQYRQSQKMEALGRLAGGVAHDFNNLLQVILGYVQFAQEEDLPHQVAADLEEAGGAAERGAALVRQLLQFSRRQPSLPSVIEPADALGDLHSLIGRMLGERHTLELELDPELPLIRVDPGQLEQIVINLCINARDAMPAGGTVRLGARPVSVSSAGDNGTTGSAAHLEITVTDHGVGMTPEVCQRAFEPFYTTKDVGKGTGLGLATVYGIVQEHGGQVELESVEGEGTTVRIVLPPTRHEEGSVPVAEVASPVQGGAERLLLAEDDPRVRRFARRVLEGSGYRLLVASDGDEARRIATRHAAALDGAVLDIVMPGSNGREVCEALQEHNPSAAVVYTTGHSMGLLDPASARAAEHVLAKPYTAEALLQAVRRAIDGHPGDPDGDHRR